MTTVLCDFGNADIKSQVLNGKPNPVNISPSCLYLVEDWQEIPFGSDESPVITYPVDGKSQTWVIGELAEQRQGAYNFTAPDKVDRTRQFLYGAIDRSLAIDKLLVSIPDATQIEHKEYLQTLVGTHSYVRNGAELTVKIRSVLAVDETFGAYKSCMQGLYAHPKLRNAIVTIGGGTVNGCLYDGLGNRINRWVCDRGLYTLATSIAGALKNHTKKTPSAASIMAAIGSEDAVKHGKYITQSGVDFSDIFPSFRDRWIAEIQNVLRESWQQQEISQVAIVGGAAPLFSEYVEHRSPRFFIPPNPQTIAIEGLQYV
jgi:Actin like proteins N terminal domain